MPFGAIIGGLIGAGGSILGAGVSAGAANNAANIQAQTARQAIQAQQNQLQQTQNNLAPWLNVGQNVEGQFWPGSYWWNFLTTNPQSLIGQNPVWGDLSQMPQLTGLPTYNMPAFTQQQFQQSPGYQYQLGETLNAATNAAPLRTGAISGNMLTALQQGAAGLSNQDWWNAYNAYARNYANQYNAQTQQALNLYNAGMQGFTNTENLKNSLYTQQLQGVAGQQSNVYNIMQALANAGQNAAANLGGLGQTAVTNQGNLLTGLGNVQAAGQIGSANAITGGINALTTNLLSSPTNTNFQNTNLGNALNYILGTGGYSSLGAPTNYTTDFSGGGGTVNYS